MVKFSSRIFFKDRNFRFKCWAPQNLVRSYITYVKKLAHQWKAIFLSVSHKMLIFVLFFWEYFPKSKIYCYKCNLVKQVSILEETFSKWNKISQMNATSGGEIQYDNFFYRGFFWGYQKEMETKHPMTFHFLSFFA